MENERYTTSDSNDDLVLKLAIDNDTQNSNMIISKEGDIILTNAKREKTIVCDEIIKSDTFFSFFVKGKCVDSISIESDNKDIRYVMTQGEEGVILNVFKYKEKVYYTTHKKLDASKCFWRGKDFLTMYKELNGPTEEELFSEGKEKTVYSFLVVHPLMQVVSHNPIGNGFVKLLYQWSEFHNYIVPSSLSVDEANEILCPQGFYGIHGGFIVIHVFDTLTEQILKTYEIHSVGYDWRRSIRGTQSDTKAALYDLIVNYARPKYMNSTGFASKFFIFNHLNKERIRLITTGEYILSDKYVLNLIRCPSFLIVTGTNDKDPVMEERRVFMKRLQIIVANFLYCLPKQELNEDYSSDPIDMVFDDVERVVRIILDIKSGNQYPHISNKRMYDLAKIWENNNSDMKTLIYQMLLNERNLYKMIKYS